MKACFQQLSINKKIPHFVRDFEFICGPGEIRTL
jgi:hypothetical protein